MNALQIILRGKVQGVYFRASAEREALRLGLFGYAKNMNDGSVLIRIEGRDEDAKSFLAWAKKGPRGTEIKSIDYLEVSNEGHKEFKVL